MQAFARLERIEARNRRAARRRRLSLGSVLAASGDEAVIHDISETGMLVETNADLATFEQLHLDLPEAGKVVATVMWNSGKYYGCEFHKPIPQSAISAALLKSPFDQNGTSPVFDEEEEVEQEHAGDRLPLRIGLGVIFLGSFALWALILWSVGIF
jgi:hypothetical protein